MCLLCFSVLSVITVTQQKTFKQWKELGHSIYVYKSDAGEVVKLCPIYNFDIYLELNYIRPSVTISFL